MKIFMFIASTKIPEREGEHPTIQLLWATAKLLVIHFIVLSTPWMKKIRTWGWSEITSYCFFFEFLSSLFVNFKSVLSFIVIF